MDPNTDSFSNDLRDAGSDRCFTMKPGSVAAPNFKRHGIHMDTDGFEALFDDNDSIMSEKFKTMRPGRNLEKCEVLRSRSVSGHSVLRLPKAKNSEESPDQDFPNNTKIGLMTSMPSKTRSDTETIFGHKTADKSKSDLHEKPISDKTSERPETSPLNKANKWLNIVSIRGMFRKDTDWQEKSKGANIEPYMISFWVIWIWSVWALVCMASMLCFLPWLDEASLWFPHFRLYLEKSSHVTWIDFFDEFLKVISYFATDLRGFSRKDYDPNIEFISNSAYSFDYSSWCRDIPMTASTTCYSGNGMDVISGIVTDLGVQIGVAGRMENPIQFGTNFAATFRSTVHDIDKIYREITESANPSAETSTLDLSKLELVHKAALSIKLGNFVWPLKVAHASCMLVFSGSLIIHLFIRKRPQLWAKISTASFLVFCETITFATYTLETIYLSELNHAAHSYDVTLTSGLGSTLMIVEFLLGLFLCVLYIFN